MGDEVDSDTPKTAIRVKTSCGIEEYPIPPFTENYFAKQISCRFGGSRKIVSGLVPNR